MVHGRWHTYLRHTAARNVDIQFAVLYQNTGRSVISTLASSRSLPESRLCEYNAAPLLSLPAVLSQTQPNCQPTDTQNIPFHTWQRMRDHLPIYSVNQTDGLNFVRLYFLNYTRYVNDLNNIWKRGVLNFQKPPLERSPSARFFARKKNLVLHSSHFALNWRCCTAVCYASQLAVVFENLWPPLSNVM